MEDQTCMEYLIQRIQRNQIKDVNQNILFNASNEFRNLWNLVKKLRELARVDVQRITRFLDAVQVGLETKDWAGATAHCAHAEHEYKQIRRYIRPSFLEDFKVSRFIENVDLSIKSKSGTKKEMKSPSPFVNHHRRQTFRNRQINKEVVKRAKDGTDSTESKQNNEAKNENDKLKDIESKEEKKNIKEIRKVSLKNTKQQKQIKNEKPKETSNQNDNNSEDIDIDTKSNTADSNDLKEADVRSGTKVVVESNHNMTTEVLSENTTLEKETENKNNDTTKESKLNVLNEDVNNTIEETSETLNSETHESGNPTSHANDSQLKNDDIKATELHHETEILENSVKENEQLETITKETKNLKSAKSNQLKSRQVKDASKVDLEVKTISKKDCINGNSENMQIVENCSDYQKGTKKAKKVINKSIDIATLVTERMTRIGFESNAVEIVMEVGHIYETDWSVAYKALTGRKPSNGMYNTIDFLGEILKVAAQKVMKIPDTDTTKLKCDKTTTEASLIKLKEEFLVSHLKKLQSEHNIDYTDGTEEERSVNVYSAKCVELSWFMFTRTPPMVFDYDSRPMLLEDLFEIFKPYKSKGNCIHYIVWPAIRHCHGGDVVAQGIADFR